MLNKTLYNQSNPTQSNTSEVLLNTKTIIQKRSLKIDRILEKYLSRSSIFSKRAGCRSTIMSKFSIILILLKINKFCDKKHFNNLN